MSRLVYKTKKPKKGYINHESSSTHVLTKEWRDKLPPQEVQSAALEIVGKAMYELTAKLKELGYDETTVAYGIHFKN